MNGSRRRGLVAVALGVGGACLAFGAVPLSATTHSVGAAAKSKWVAASLTSVSVAPHSASAWAVGDHSTIRGNQRRYVVRRKGKHWVRVKANGGSDAQLLAIAAASPKSVWAVGHTGFSETNEPLIEHSTGGRFTPVNVNLGAGALDAASASSPSNVWAVGLPPPFTTNLPIVVHWNGKKWQSVDDHAQRGYGTNAVSTSSRYNTWILGTKSRRNIVGVWNGHTITSRPPIPVPPHTALVSIATTGPKDTWVVGWTRHGAHPLKTFTTHWNGLTWKRFKAPSPSYNSQGTSVSAAGKRVYLAGVGLTRSQAHQTPYFARFIHGKWKLVHAPTRGKSSNLAAISVSSKSGAAVGFYATTTAKRQPTELPFTASLHGTTWKPGTAPR